MKPPATPAPKPRSRPARKPSVQSQLPLPHERDEGVGKATNPEVDPVMQQAHDDIVSGQVDTDMRATPGLDHALRKRLVPGSR